MGFYKAYFLLLFAFLGFFYYKYQTNSQVTVEETILTLSELLKRVTGAVGLLQELDFKVTEQLENDPFQLLIDERVKPSYDELASIKKQTEIYEGMGRIQGGPANFMATSIKVVERLEIEIVETEQMVMYRKVVYKMTDDLDSAQENFLALGDEIHLLFFQNSQELERIGIALPPMAEDGNPPEYHENVTFDQIIPVLTTLIPLCARFEKAGLELNKTLTEMGISTPFQFKQVKGTPAEAILRKFDRFDKDIERVVESHLEELTSLGPVIAGTLNTMSKKLVQIAPHHMKTKEKYEKLVSILDYDLVRTKERINDLKKPLKPIADEL